MVFKNCKCHIATTNQQQCYKASAVEQVDSNKLVIITAIVQ